MTFTISKTRLAIGIMAVALLLPTSAMAFHVFDDVPDDRFYAGPVEWAFDNGITTGKTVDLFAPDDGVTRGESVTFLKRYNDNVVEPADEALQADIDDNADEIADLASAATADIVTSHGPSGWFNNSSATATTFQQDSGGLVFSGDGFANLSLVGPSEHGGNTYSLKSVEYCLYNLTGGATVSNAWIFGYNETTALFGNDSTNRSTTGCYTVEPTEAVKATDAYTFALDGSGGGTLTVGAVTATWEVDTGVVLLSPGSATPADTSPPESRDD